DKMKLERLGTRIDVKSKSGIMHPIRLRRTGQSSEVYPVRNFWSRDFSSAVHKSFKDPTPSRSIAVLEISNRANPSFVLTEPKAKGYASECNELFGSRRIQSL
ncbi:MAG: hypothetical protein OEW70_04360, partial [candidate division WOR-3 bacterium]|nr:hypothetical protein [candidate division WOR-3 bacterium]